MAFLHNRNAIHTLTVGLSGVGKSYYRGIRFLIEEWLPEHDGDFWHNLPINAQYVAEEAALRCKKPVDVLYNRLKKIPGVVEDSWRTGASGPWHFFCGFTPDGFGENAIYKDPDGKSWDWYEEHGERDDKGVIQYPHAMSLSKSRLCLDEIQDYCGGDKDKEHKGQWMKFLATYRHFGGTTECMTQQEMMVAHEYRRHVSVKYELVDSSQERMKYTGFCKGDLLELLAAYTRNYCRPVSVFESAKLGDQWSLVATDRFILSPKYFEFYDTDSQAAGGGKSGKEEPHEFEKRGFVGVHLWFLRRNWILATGLALCVAFGVWLACYGGGGQMFQWLAKSGMAVIDELKAQQAARAAEKRGGKPLDKPAGGKPDQSVEVVTGISAKALPAEVKKQLDAVAVHVVKLEKENAVWRARYDEEWTLCEVGKDCIGFRNGDHIRLGEHIPEGPLKGEMPVTIDWWRRTVIFKSGRTVRMRFDWKSARDKLQSSDVGGPDAGKVRNGGQAGDIRGPLSGTTEGGGVPARAGS
ncbi:MAG: hypothetical protein K8T25_07105 [Planctomycetia bacterium]|nr:hypothetical protein [Planctomycetia bacterium]